MGSLAIRRCAVADLRAAPNLDALVAEYAAESALSGLPHVSPQWAIYESLEQVGAIYPLAATVDDVLVGGLVLVVSVNPHYGVKLGVTESFFVASDARATGAGMALLGTAEALSRELGAVAMMVCAPTGGRLERVLPGRGYGQTNAVFMKGLT